MKRMRERVLRKKRKKRRKEGKKERKKELSVYLNSILFSIYLARVVIASHLLQNGAAILSPITHLIPKDLN